MDNKPLVSVITPCHNSAAYIYRLMDSLLSQSYTNMEIIVVDNDSKDNTADIVKDYFIKLEKKGYYTKYIHQDDLGPSAAMQTGFKYIKGKYLIMPDSDDYYSSPTSIETFVNKFESLPDEYAIIRSQLLFINEENMQPIGMAYENFPEDDPGTLFEDCLYGRNGYNFAPIDYMVRVSALCEMTGLKIYNAYNTGQQRQICLPLYYKYKAWTISEPLVCYLVRKSSISHGEYSKYSTKAILYNKAPEYIDSILGSIDSMPQKEKDYYRTSYLQQRAISIAVLAFETRNYSDIEKYLSDYKKYGGNPWKVRYFFLKKIFRQIMGRLIKENNVIAQS